MADERTIKIFLASSEELKDERIAFGDFIRQLDDTYEQRGFRIKLIKWEDLPKGYNGRPTQETYNDEVRQCDLFVSLFYTKAGEFTKEEFNVAKQTQKECQRPTIYVFIRTLKPDDKEDPSLIDFKNNVLGVTKHYWTNYESTDSLQLQFVMELLKVENIWLDALKVDNGIIRWGVKAIAEMDNLNFASGNKDYRRIKQRLQELPDDISDARLLADSHPESQRYQDKLQKLLKEQNDLQKELDDQQNLLFDTAKRIAQLLGDTITDSMQRAAEAFEAGDVAKANTILDEAERHGDMVYDDYLHNEEIQQRRRQNVHNTIDELLLQTSTVMADMAHSIEQRKQKVYDLYKKADERAAKTQYNKEKYEKLLFDYAQFIDRYAYPNYNEAISVYLRQIALSEELYGTEHSNTATSYNNIGLAYWNQGDYPQALEYHFKALSIREKVLGKEHSDTATSYNNIGAVYYAQGDYPQALEYYFKALSIREKVFGKEHPDTATSYNNIAWVYRAQKEYNKALDYYIMAYNVRKNKLGPQHPDTISAKKSIDFVKSKLAESKI